MVTRESTEEHTVFEYMYRDAGNWKTSGSLLLVGASGDAEAVIRGCLDWADQFVVEFQSVDEDASHLLVLPCASRASVCSDDRVLMDSASGTVVFEPAVTVVALDGGAIHDPFVGRVVARNAM